MVIRKYLLALLIVQMTTLKLSQALISGPSQHFMARGLTIAGQTINRKLPHFNMMQTKQLSTSATNSNSCDALGNWRPGPPVALSALVVCGPSGVGKGTIISNFMENGGAENFGFSVSHTTREPRPGEIDGVHYHFVTHTKMTDAIQRGEFLEYAQVHGNMYGTSFKSIEHVSRNEGKTCLLDIDVQGVKNMKNHRNDPPLDAKYIFIAPPSLEILQNRLMSRGTETMESLRRRTENAMAEVEYGTCKGNFDFVLINNDLEIACRDFDYVVKKLFN